MTFPPEIVLYRTDSDGPYRIGIDSDGEHAFGILRPDVRVRRHAAGEWVFMRPQTEEELPHTGDLTHDHWRELIPDYPLQALAPMQKRSVANGVRSHLAFRLIVRGVSHDDWKLTADREGLVLHTSDDQLLSRVQVPDWWFAREEEWLCTLAQQVVDATGLKRLGIPQLLAEEGGGRG